MCIRDRPCFARARAPPTPPATPVPAQSTAAEAGGAAGKRPRAGGSLELFGPLVQMMEARIDSDDALRERLIQQEDERVATRKAALTARMVSRESGWIARHS